MGKKGGSTTTTGGKTSSGKRKASRAKKALVQVKMKIKRWERYKAEEKTTSKKSKRAGWDTTGLKKHAELLQSFI